MLGSESTVPLNFTTPLSVVTSIWDVLSKGSFKIAALTFAVITESSMYSPAVPVFSVTDSFAPSISFFG
jgi:hypothetical protein